MLVSEDAQDPAQKQAKLQEAREAFQQAHDAFDKAAKQLDAEYKKYEGFIDEGDPRTEKRDKLLTAKLDAMLKRGVTIYELAESYPAGSKERIDKLNEALEQFKILEDDYRSMFAGLTAQMWHAKCFEEQGKISEAIGLYEFLLKQPAPQLRA